MAGNPGLAAARTRDLVKLYRTNYLARPENAKKRRALREWAGVRRMTTK